MSSEPSKQTGDAVTVGQTISHYRIVKKLGEGGMGMVYKAEDTRLNRFVALKFLSNDLANNPEALSRFRNEARAASALNHPNICTIYDVAEHGGRPLIAMEFVDGTSLRQRIGGRPLPLDEVLSLAGEIADGLEAAHGAGVVHRDIKPANISVTRSGHAKILDFGLAKITLSADLAGLATTAGGYATTEGSASGTIPYMSPEQVRGEQLDTRTDLFSFGVMLYEMVTGKQPFDGATAGSVFDSILNRTPVPVARLNPDAPADLQRIVDKCLEKDRSLRYQHASEIRADLQRLKRDSSTSTAAEKPASGSKTKRWKTLAVAAVLILLSVAVGIRSYLGKPPKLTDKDTIVLADFNNTTGDAVFDGALRQGLSIQLEQSPFLSLISEERIGQTLQLMGKPVDSRLTPELGREICERTASAAVLDGSIASLGTQYVLGLRAKSCRTGDVLDEEQLQASRKEDVLNSLTQMASRFRTRIGESLATIEKHSTPLAEATTPSLDALKAYDAALKAATSVGSADALPFLKRAIELDPNFAMAYAFQARMYGDINESTLSAESATKAWKLRTRASDRERFFIDSAYDVQVTGNVVKAEQTAKLWAQTYPRDPNAHGLLSGAILPNLGKYQEALAEAIKLMNVDPNLNFGYNLLGYGYMAVDRINDAERTMQEASDRKLEMPDLLVQRYQIAFLKGDAAEMARIIAAGQGKPGAEDSLSDQEAFALAYSGHLQQANTKAEHAAELAQHAGQRDRAAAYQIGATVWQSLFGDATAVKRSASTLLQLAKSRDAEYGLAFALALSGDSVQSQTLAADLEKRFPEDTMVRYNYSPTIRALVALNHNQPQEAIELLKTTSAYETGSPPSAFYGYFGILYPVYVRGLALLKLQRGAEAAVEFQKIADRRGIIFSDPIGALIHLQFGRAYALSGDNSKARSAYTDFLNLWKDADRTVPILKEAQSEFAKLQ
jgi:serine/threonine protein kinase/tetratricopeptide (TPR) repeat protein